MKCEDVDLLLDDRQPHELTLADRDMIDAHLASCAECRSAWEAYGTFAGLERPNAPADLGPRIIARVEAALATGHRRRSLPLIGACFVIGAAAAAAVMMRGPAPSTDHRAATIEEPASVIFPPAPPISIAPAELGASGRRAASSPAEASAGLAEPEAASRTPLRIAVLPVVDGDVDRSLIPMFGAFYDEVRARLATLGWDVVRAEDTVPYVDAGLPEEEIATQVDADRILVLVLQQGDVSVSAIVIDGTTGRRLSVSSSGQLVGAPADVWRERAGFHVEAVERSRNAPAPEEIFSLIAEAEAKLLDRSLSFAERADALSRIGTKRASDAVVAAVVELGTNAEDPQIRNRAWSAMKGVGNRYLVQPLIDALAGDPDYNVRRSAAFTLGDFLAEPGVRGALARAAEEDAEDTVRSAARRSLTSNEEIYSSAIATLLDESLPARRRLSAVRGVDGVFGMLAGSGIPIGMTLDEQALRKVLEITTSTNDANVRSLGWIVLGQQATESEFIGPLLDDALGHASARVRRSAVSALEKHVDDPNVRAALERLRDEDPAWEVRRGAREALGEVERMGP